MPDYDIPYYHFLFLLSKVMLAGRMVLSVMDRSGVFLHRVRWTGVALLYLPERNVVDGHGKYEKRLPVHMVSNTEEVLSAPPSSY